MLFLVLLSGSVAKWAYLSPTGERGLAVGQLVLTIGVGALMGAAVLWNGWVIVRRWRVSGWDESEGGRRGRGPRC